MSTWQMLREKAGRMATVAAAGLVFAMVAVPALAPTWFGLDRLPGVPGFLALGLISASLLDRFRPTRWFLLVSLPAGWVMLSVLGTSSDWRPVVAFQTVCATATWVLLNSAPVRDYFRLGDSWTARFFRRARGDAALDAGETARLWDDPEPRERERVPAGTEAAPGW